MSETTLGARRSRRAAAARLLEALDARERWCWEDLERVPDWSLLEPDARRRLQCLVGAVRVLPSLLRCIDGRRLKAVRETLGAVAFGRLLDADTALDVHALATATRDAAACDFDALAGADVDAVAKALSQGGAAVLLGTLDPALRRTAFVPLVGPTRSDVVAADDAAAILDVALGLADADDVSGPSSSAATAATAGAAGAKDAPDAPNTNDALDTSGAADMPDAAGTSEASDASAGRASPAGSPEDVAA